MRIVVDENSLKHIKGETIKRQETKQENFFNCKLLILPHSRFLFLWEIIFCCFMLISIFMTPFHIAFDFQSFPQKLFDLDLGIDGVQLTDMILKSVTTFKQPISRNYEHRWWKVGLAYLKGRLVLDLLVLVPSLVFKNRNEYFYAFKLLRWCYLFRLSRLVEKLVAYLRKWKLVNDSKEKMISSFFMFALVTFIILHNIACTYLWLGFTSLV